MQVVELLAADSSGSGRVGLVVVFHTASTDTVLEIVDSAVGRCVGQVNLSYTLVRSEGVVGPVLAALVSRG